jgi:hypothetical protein
MVLPADHSKFRFGGPHEGHLYFSCLFDSVIDRCNPFKTHKEVSNLLEAVNNNQVFGVSDIAPREHIPAV